MRGFAVHLEWERLCSRPAGRSCRWPEAYGGRGASLWEWLLFEEEYYRAGRARSGSPRTASSCSPPRSSSSAPRSSRTTSCRGWRAAEDLWCQGWSEPGAGSDLAGIRSRARARRGGRRLAADRPEDLDDPRRVLHAPVRALPHRPGGGAPQRAHVLPRAARRARASPCAASAGSTATRASPRSSSTTSSCPTTDVLGGVGRGLVGRDGDDRLRARADAALARAASCAPPTGCSTWPRAKGAATAQLGTQVVAGVDRGRGLRAVHPGTVTAIVEGRRLGAESSLNKLFWSELDVRLHETAARPARSRGRARRAVERRASCSRCPGPSTPAPTRSSATSSPSGARPAEEVTGRDALRRSRTGRGSRRGRR